MMPWNTEVGRSVSHLREYFVSNQAIAHWQELREIAILGAAEEGVRLHEISDSLGIRVLGVFDADQDRVGTRIAATVVRPMADLPVIPPRVPFVTATHRVSAANLALRRYGRETIIPFPALQIAFPEAFPPHPYYDGWLRDLHENRHTYRSLLGVWSDPESRRVLEAILAFKMTLNGDFLTDRATPESEYHPPELWTFGENEVFVDGGSLDGDSIEWFRRRTGDRFDAVLAFEPDPGPFACLKAKFAADDRIRTFNAGLHEFDGMLPFAFRAGKESGFARSGECRLPVLSLDSVVDDLPVTFIKLNIEGAEEAAIRGARRTIRKFHPKMAVSVYHRPGDLLVLYRVLTEIADGYRYSLRLHDLGIVQLILYALPQETARNTPAA